MSSVYVKYVLGVHEYSGCPIYNFVVNFVL